MSPRSFVLLAAAAAGLFFVSSCGGSSSANDANLIAFNDFEAVVGWMPDPSTVSREQAHGHRGLQMQVW